MLILVIVEIKITVSVMFVEKKIVGLVCICEDEGYEYQSGCRCQWVTCENPAPL